MKNMYFYNENTRLKFNLKAGRGSIFLVLNLIQTIFCDYMD